MSYQFKKYTKERMLELEDMINNFEKKDKKLLNVIKKQLEVMEQLKKRIEWLELAEEYREVHSRVIELESKVESLECTSNFLESTLDVKEDYDTRYGICERVDYLEACVEELKSKKEKNNE